MGCKIIEKDYEWRGSHIGDLVKIKEYDDIYEIAGFVEDENDDGANILVITRDRFNDGFYSTEEIFEFNYDVSTTEKTKHRLVSGDETYKCKWEYYYDLTMHKKKTFGFWFVK